MDAIEVLIEDHRAINRAFLRYEDAPSGHEVERREAFDEIRRRLTWHTATEQQFLHPLIAAHLPDADDRVTDDLDDHRELATLLRAAGRCQPGDRDTLVHQLIVTVRRHMESEERELYPLLRRLVEQEKLSRLGDAIATAREGEPGRQL